MTYAYITGGGTKWIYDSLKKGGASKWFLGGRIPYNQKDFDEILGGQPFDGKYVSERTAAQLSVAAYSRAVKLTNDETDSIGIGSTAKLGTTGQRKGRENKIIISITRVVRGDLQTYMFEHKFPSWMPRILQERSCSKLIDDCLKYKTIMSIASDKHFDKLDDLKPSTIRSVIVYSGSFNPMHDAHFDIIRQATQRFDNCEFCLEIPSRNFSKGFIGPWEMSTRKAEIKNTPQVWSYPVVFSKASTFVEKARILCSSGFTSIVFPMGDDTYDRITDEEKDVLVSLGVSILLFKRHKDNFPDNHPIIHPSSNTLPKLLSISSTEIRKNAI